MQQIKTPFDFVKNIKDKSGHSYSDENKQNYNSFVINRALSMGLQTLFFANEMNRKHHLDKDLQYDFYYYGMPKVKGFDKWIKSDEKSQHIELISEYYSCSFDKAKEIINILNDAQIQSIKDILQKGGRTKS